jgi:hypothetical protein
MRRPAGFPLVVRNNIQTIALRITPTTSIETAPERAKGGIQLLRVPT